MVSKMCMDVLSGLTVVLYFLLIGNLNDLVQHGLRALRETLPAEQDLTTKVRISAFSLIMCQVFCVSCCLSGLVICSF